MFEAAVRDSAHKLVLQQEVAETGGVDADVAALFVASSVAGGEAALSRSRAAVGGRLGGLDLLVGVVNEVFLVRHGECSVGSSGGCDVELVSARVASKAAKQSGVAKEPGGARLNY
jgi:hypothetical protein